MTLPAFKQITIVGPGLLGASIGLALKHAGFIGRIVGVARSQATRDTALARNCIDDATDDLLAAARHSDLILLATPVNTIIRQLSELRDVDAIITDVGSTKRSIVHAASQVLKHPERFVGSHPMAGSENTGPEHARADLFKGKPVIMTPSPATEEATMRGVEQLWKSLGMLVYKAAPELHDQMVAHISHVPHVMAGLLVLLAEQGGGLHVASTGFTDTTRLASGDPQLWADILTDNRKQVVRALDELSALIDDLRHRLTDGQREPVCELLETAQRIRNRWLKENAERNHGI